MSGSSASACGSAFEAGAVLGRPAPAWPPSTETVVLMRTRPQLFALFFALTVSVQPQSQVPTVDASNFTPAIRAQVEEAGKAARAHPRDPQTIGAFAMTLHAYQRYDSAAVVYSRAHLLEPRSFDWLYLLGAVQMELGRFDAAAASFQSAFDLAPSNLIAELKLAQAAAASNHLQEAEAHYRHILRMHSDWPRAWYGLGRVQSALGNRAAAAESYAKACELFPTFGAAHFALAQELRRQGRQDEAKRHMQAYSASPGAEPPLDDPLLQRVSQFNRGAQVHMQRAVALERAGSTEDAIREQEAALAADPGNVQAHVNLIALYGRTGHPEKAKEHIEAALRLSPGRSDVWYNYGVLLLREPGDPARAEEAFRRALEINPDHAEARDNLGLIYEGRGHFDEAAREFRQAVASRPDYPLARFHLGRLLANQEKYDEAVHQFQRALKPESDRTPTYLYALAATLARAGRREEARHYYQQARDAARQQGQSQLMDSIERDLRRLGVEP